MCAMKQLPFVLTMIVVFVGNNTILSLANAEKTATRQCNRYTNVKEELISGTQLFFVTYLTSTSLCIRGKPKSSWHRLSFTLNVPFEYANLFDSPGETKCFINTVLVHPCRAYETTTRIIFIYKTVRVGIGLKIQITNCGSFYVYRLLDSFKYKIGINTFWRFKKTHPPNTSCNVSIKGKKRESSQIFLFVCS